MRKGFTLGLLLVMISTTPSHAGPILDRIRERIAERRAARQSPCPAATMAPMRFQLPRPQTISDAVQSFRPASLWNGRLPLGGCANGQCAK